MVDFGLSIRTKDRANTICGTPAYMAPEMIHPTEDGSEISYTNSVDLWGFGVLLCDMAGGHTPFDFGS